MMTSASSSLSLRQSDEFVAHLPSSSTYVISPPESFADPDWKDGDEGDVALLADVLSESGERGGTSSISSQVVCRVTKHSYLEGGWGLCDEGAVVYPSNALMAAHWANILKSGFDGMNSNGSLPAILLIVGSGGLSKAVGVHKVVIASYSRMIFKQMVEYPDFATVVLPNYSEEVIRKVVQILYTGEVVYKYDDEVILVWEAMRELGIHVDAKQFQWYPVQVVKVEAEEEEVNGGLQAEARGDVVQVDEESGDVQEIIFGNNSDGVVVGGHDDDNNDQNKAGENRAAATDVAQTSDDSKICNVKIISKPGRGVLIRRHVVGGKNLFRASPRVKVEEDCDDGAPDAKKMRISDDDGASNVITDDEFKTMLAAGKIVIGGIARLGEEVKERDVSGGDTAETVVLENTSVVQQQQQSARIVIPPFRPDGTGIMILGRSATPERVGAEVMPTLIPVEQIRRQNNDNCEIPCLNPVYDQGSDVRARQRRGGGTTTRGRRSRGRVRGGRAGLRGISGEGRVTRGRSNSGGLGGGGGGEPTPGPSSSVAPADGGVTTVNNVERGNASNQIARYLALEEVEERNLASVIIVGSKKMGVPKDGTRVDVFADDDEDVQEDLANLPGPSSRVIPQLESSRLSAAGEAAGSSRDTVSAPAQRVEATPSSGTTPQTTSEPEAGASPNLQIVSVRGSGRGRRRGRRGRGRGRGRRPARLPRD